MLRFSKLSGENSVGCAVQKAAPLMMATQEGTVTIDDVVVKKCRCKHFHACWSIIDQVQFSQRTDLEWVYRLMYLIFIQKNYSNCRFRNTNAQIFLNFVQFLKFMKTIKKLGQIFVADIFNTCFLCLLCCACTMFSKNKN